MTSSIAYAFAGLAALGAVAACSAKPRPVTGQKANPSTRDSAYFRQAPDFSKTNLVIRVPAVIFRGDTLSLAVQLRNLGQTAVRIADIRLGMSSDSAGVRVDGARIPFEGMAPPRRSEIRPNEEAEMPLTRWIPRDPVTLGMLRCGQPFFLELLLAQFDDSLRPRVLTLTIGSFRRETFGVKLRARAFRYFVAENRSELESRSEYPAPSSPGFLTPLTKRMLALEMDSSSTLCMASKREFERSRKRPS